MTRVPVEYGRSVGSYTSATAGIRRVWALGAAAFAGALVAFVSGRPGHESCIRTRSMPYLIVSIRRFGLRCGAILSACGVGFFPLAGQELQLQRVYPGSGPHICAPSASGVASSPHARSAAAQLASDANRAMILGDLERVEALLAQAIELDPSSADIAYRHGRVLQDLERVEPAIAEYCRALDLGVDSLGVQDARERITDLSDLVVNLIPELARNAFERGLRETDDSLYVAALESFTEAMDEAPAWPEPLYNRAVVHERLGEPLDALQDFQSYVRLVVPERVGGRW